MIGFTVDIEMWVGGDDALQERAVFTLDTDLDEPTVDLRLASSDDVIISVDVADLGAAVEAIQAQFETWKWQRKIEAEEAAS